jgi:DNA-binding NtrC family response regulator
MSETVLKRILFVDDEESVRYSFKKLMNKPPYHVTDVSNGQEALAFFEKEIPDLVVLDIEMPGMSGLDVLQKIKELSPITPVLIITAYGTGERVIRAMKYGAYEYLEKPFDVPRLKELIEEAINAGQAGKKEIIFFSKSSGDYAVGKIIGNSPAIKEVFKMIGRVAASDANILLVGESGTGKELVARAIHQYSNRSDKIFIPINCAAIPDTLLESEMFGYEKGSFTGASASKTGKFELADKGIIFLDEIGDMSLAIQSKLLRVLQDGTFERLGSSTPIHVDVRIIAATNKNLENGIADKNFREDLYYRLKVITITLPPLRMRKDDIPELVKYFLTKYGYELNRQSISITSEALDQLIKYDWPGNIRELENLLNKATLFCKTNVITPDLLKEDLKNPVTDHSNVPGSSLSVVIPSDIESYEGRLYKKVMDDVGRDLILHVLRLTRGNQAKAAKILGISRVMLHERVEKYGLKPESY